MFEYRKRRLPMLEPFPTFPLPLSCSCLLSYSPTSEPLDVLWKFLRRTTTKKGLKWKWKQKKIFFRAGKIGSHEKNNKKNRIAGKRRKIPFSLPPKWRKMISMRKMKLNIFLHLLLSSSHAVVVVVNLGRWSSLSRSKIFLFHKSFDIKICFSGSRRKDVVLVPLSPTPLFRRVAFAVVCSFRDWRIDE